MIEVGFGTLGDFGALGAFVVVDALVEVVVVLPVFARVLVAIAGTGGF